MVTTVVKCYHCGSDNLVKNGHDPKGKQRYFCKDCKRASLDNPDYGYSEAKKEEVLRVYQERPSLRGTARTFGMSRNTVTAWLKKSPEHTPFARHAGRTG